MQHKHLNSINRDSTNREFFRKAQNEMNIFPYITIKENSINRENLQKLENNLFPINGIQLYDLMAI